MLVACSPASDSPEPGYCNPIDLDYGWGTFKNSAPMARTSADPVIVLFKDKYYLFSTHDIRGYRVSDDLLHWHNRFFNQEVAGYAFDQDGSYTAPAVAADDNYVYFMRLNRNREEKTVKILRTTDPDQGKWEVCSEIRRTSDPSIFIDKGRFFVFHGLGTDQSIKCFELDPVTMTEIPGSERLLKDYITNVNDCKSGYYFGRREIYDEIDASNWKGRFKWLPCPEGSWVIRHNNKYYMQFASPGTICIWYCDVLMTSSSPNEGYVEENYNPLSLKVGGFIGSAGHSSVFKDRYDNYWQVTTMWVGSHNEFERRLGLFPVSFDAQGRMRVHTTFGDYPMLVPQYKFDASKGNLKGWNVLSYRKACSASSSDPGYGPGLAADENVRTWWSAASGNKGEWLMMDLGQEMRVNALQLNFAEHDTDETLVKTEDYTAYLLEASSDAEHWSVLIDKTGNKAVNPHDYEELPAPVQTRFLRITNHHAMDGGKFAIRDLRVFGHGGGEAPAEVLPLEAVRDAEDERFARISWKPVEGADGYLVRFGIAPDFLNQVIQVKGGENGKLGLHILTKGMEYYYAIDSYNQNGVTKGKVNESKF